MRLLILCLTLAAVAFSQTEQSLVDLILQSKAYPSVNSTSQARLLAQALMKEELLYSESYRNPSPVELPPFPCPLTGRSTPRPTDARKLRPADIDVVGTIGDSVAAGFGALSTTIFTIFTEYRGYSFPVGGQVVYDSFQTVPNMLKLYNPNVKGFSVGNGGQTSANAVLNSAVSGARSYDLPAQVDYLEARMRALGVDFNNDWKLISIFVGGNDLCDYCKDTVKNSPTNYRNNLEFVLDAIKNKFPKVFVNLIAPPDVTLLGEVSTGLCSILHAYECACAPEEETKVAHGEYTRLLAQLVTQPKYHNKPDFFVSYQPFLQNLTLPMKDGVPDRSYFAPDCFHFSGKSHQASAVALWNNMCESPANKKVTWTPGEPVECPAEFLQ